MTIDSIIMKELSDRFNIDDIVKVTSHIDDRIIDELTIRIELNDCKKYELTFKHDGTPDSWLLDWRRLKRGYKIDKINNKINFL